VQNQGSRIGKDWTVGPDSCTDDKEILERDR